MLQLKGKTRKLLSLVLSIVVVLGLLSANPIKAYAAEPEFYAVFNTNAEGGKPANTLSFYYDTNKGSRTGSPYEDLPTEATAKEDWGYNSIRGSVNNVVIDASVKNYKGLKSTAYMFYGMTDANNVSGCENLDTSQVTNMKCMFQKFAQNSTAIKAVPDVSEWSTGNVTDMSYMFNYYAHDKSTTITAVPDVSEWNTGNVENMSFMFSGYAYASTAITGVPDVSKWNTGKVTNLATMFSTYAYSNTAFTAVPDVSEWDTDNVEDMSSMFSKYANSSESITAVPDVSKWNTGKVTNMDCLFKNYAYSSQAKLKALDLSKWKIDSLTSASCMFNSYAKSNTQGDPIVYATDWSAKITSIGGGMEIFTDSKLKYADKLTTVIYQWPNANTGATGCFTKKLYTVTFDMKGHGTQVESQTVAQDEKVVMPEPDPTASGYVFGGWYKETGCSNAWDFDKDTVTENTTLYAKWNDKAPAPDAPAGLVVTNPSYEGGSDGKITGVDDTMEYSTDEMETWTKVTGSEITGLSEGAVYVRVAETASTKAGKETCVAVGNILLFDVTFKNYYGNDTDKVVKVASGSNAKRPDPDPTCTGWNFIDWFKDSEKTIEWIFDGESGADDFKILADTNIYAEWERAICTVSFDSDGGEPAPEMQYVRAGECASEPQKPVKDGFGFKGWYYENAESQIEKWDFSNPVSADLELVALWSENPEPEKLQREETNILGSSYYVPAKTGTWNDPVTDGTWKQDADGKWTYTTNAMFKNTWGYILNPYAADEKGKYGWFWFDENGKMLTGWQFINGKWYYLNTDSSKGCLGMCLLNTTTPDGYKVDENGARIS